MARPQFHELVISDIRDETSGAKSIAFAVPDDLKEALAFKQGQYLTLRTMLDDKRVMRPYSLCAAPSDGEWRVCIKQDGNGGFSAFANEQLEVGDTLDVMGKAMGRFYAPIEPEKAKTYVMLAGGSGITPVLSNVREILAREPKSQITLFYGNRTRRDIIFREFFNDLKNQHMTRVQVFHVLSDEVPDVPLLEGMMTREKVAELISKLTLPETVDYFFICGPQPMMDGAKAALEELGIEKDAIKMESFGSRPVSMKEGGEDEEEIETADVDIIVDGMRTSLEVPYNVESILDFALESDIEVPFSCKSGICSTCRAKLVSGQVEMGEVNGLEDDEITAGYILTCSSRPKSPKIVIDYDG
jgi:ring-1,2-phenylacetyl-CoA epoxidase subunit PaaE